MVIVCNPRIMAPISQLYCCSYSYKCYQYFLPRSSVDLCVSLWISASPGRELCASRSKWSEKQGCVLFEWKTQSRRATLIDKLSKSSMFRSLLWVLLHRRHSIIDQPYQNQITIKGMIKLMKQGYFHCVDKGKASYLSSSTGTILTANKAKYLY